MTRITIIGATGFVGSALASEASRRGHAVTGVSRKGPSRPVEGVSYVTGSVRDEATTKSAVSGADAVVLALSPGSEPLFTETVQSAVAEVAAVPARLIVVGGAGATRIEPDGPRVAEMNPFPSFLTDRLPQDVLEREIKPVAAILPWLESAGPNDLKWLYVSPPFALHDGETTGRYQFTPPVADFTVSISVGDLAAAVVDEMEEPQRSGHVSVRALP